MSEWLLGGKVKSVLGPNLEVKGSFFFKFYKSIASENSIT